MIYATKSFINILRMVLCMFDFWRAKTNSDFCCSVPSTVLNIYEDGKVSFCCTSWQPHYIGNINTQSLVELMTSTKAIKIQQSVTFGDFSYCNKELCPSLVSMKMTNQLTEPLAKTQVPHWTKSKKLTLYLNYDKSCNLRCPSCRTDYIFYRKNQLPTSLSKTHTAVLSNIFDLLALNYSLELNITGSGDPFASAVYSDLLEELCDRANISFTLQTNGILMTEARFHSRLKEKTQHINVSIDAGTESTYEKIRPGGKWSQLKKNVLLLDQSIINGELPLLSSWQLNFIVQDGNYREIPLFLDWAFELKSKPNIWFNLIDDWGHLDKTKYNDMAIWKTSHPKHQDFLQTLSKIPKGNSQIIQSNLMQYYQF